MRVVKLVEHRRFGANWKTPRRKAFEPVGITVGAEVSAEAARVSVVRPGDPGNAWWTSLDSPITGQVWAPLSDDANAVGRIGVYGPAWWIVTDDGSAYAVPEYAITILGQCDGSQGELFEAAE